MGARRFEAGVRQNTRPVIIDLHGEIDSHARPLMTEVYEKALEQSQGAIILNFTDVNYINSSGIAVIVGLLTRSRQDERELRAYGLSDHYRDLFEITRLSDFLRIFPDEESAITSETVTIG